MSRWIVIMTLSIITMPIIISSDAWSQQSLQGLEDSNQFERALRAVDAIKYGKKLQCVISTANASVCRCLSQELPVDTHIRSYVAIVNGDRDAQDYGRLSAADQATVDRCVTDRR